MYWAGRMFYVPSCQKRLLTLTSSLVLFTAQFHVECVLYPLKYDGVVCLYVLYLLVDFEIYAHQSFIADHPPIVLKFRLVRKNAFEI